MYRRDRNYEQLFNDVRNKLDQVGFCIGGNRAKHVTPDIPRNIRLVFRHLPFSSALKACPLISWHALNMRKLAFFCQSGFTKERDKVKHFQFPKFEALLSSMTLAT